MWNCSRFVAYKLALSCMAVLGLFLLTTEVWAQEENTRKPVERHSVEEHNFPREGGNTLTSTPNKTTATKSILPLLPPKKEVHTSTQLQEKEKESKKNESPSTLSFNIFLYIVDKFKQDLD